MIGRNDYHLSLLVFEVFTVHGIQVCVPLFFFPNILFLFDFGLFRRIKLLRGQIFETDFIPFSDVFDFLLRFPFLDLEILFKVYFFFLIVSWLYFDILVDFLKPEGHGIYGLVEIVFFNNTFILEVKDAYMTIETGCIKFRLSDL